VSYAPQSGLALAPEEPRAAATAILRIEAARRRTVRPTAQRRRIGETETYRRIVWPLDKAKVHGRIRR
jgi:hypothetical protein